MATGGSTNAEFHYLAIAVQQASIGNSMISNECGSRCPPFAI
nr:hypothetical protein [Devosia psychrophila]